MKAIIQIYLVETWRCDDKESIKGSHFKGIFMGNTFLREITRIF